MNDDNLPLKNDFSHQLPKISVIGVGNAAGNAVDHMIDNGLNVSFLVANTDTQALSMSKAQIKIQLDDSLIKGLDLNDEASLKYKDTIIFHLSNSDIVFIIAGLGGCTGTWVAPIIAQYTQENRKKIVSGNSIEDDHNNLIIGVVTEPFDFEEKNKFIIAKKGLDEMRKHVDALIVIPNKKLFKTQNRATTFREMFLKSDEVIKNCIESISSLIVEDGLITVDFSDVKSVLSNCGQIVIGTGYGSGEDRAISSVLDAMSNPILDQLSFKKAKNFLVNVTGGDDLTLFEIDSILNRIKDEVNEDANIVFGAVYDEEKTGAIFVSVIATGIVD
ncbi:MAG: cell division protein FtsZ [Thiofilum sp.]|uniref:cell division protein FtsZ n=1 Tax=Thiofilum sp. TaxID=2212733 RepID=UPI0025F75B36|nr:cell division protein FtsZ [Thiofilum sp.]MBK8453011.1 cell division protein FtsZ [Thiofilum sp.]